MPACGGRTSRRRCWPASRRPGASCRSATSEAIENLPNWHDWAPRFSAVLDVFGNGKTALKYSVNRYNQIRTTGIAANYNPLLSQTATLPWRDTNGNDIAEGERGCTGYPRVGCEIDFTTLSSNFGIAALNEFGDYPRTWNLENAFELQQEVLPGLSLSTAFFHGGFRNLTTTINQNWSLADYTPYTFYNPLTGEPARGLRPQRRRHAAAHAQSGYLRSRAQAVVQRLPAQLHVAHPRRRTALRRLHDGA